MKVSAIETVDHRWIAYAGLLIILYVAVEMMYRGTDEVVTLVVFG